MLFTNCPKQFVTGPILSDQNHPILKRIHRADPGKGHHIAAAKVKDHTARDQGGKAAYDLRRRQTTAPQTLIKDDGVHGAGKIAHVIRATAHVEHKGIRPPAADQTVSALATVQPVIAQ